LLRSFFVQIQPLCFIAIIVRNAAENKVGKGEAALLPEAFWGFIAIADERKTATQWTQITA